MRTFCMVVSYDGSAYSGWQRQSSHQSIQGTIEKRLSKLINETVQINGAGRTDAGVHSLSGQTASFEIEANISAEQLKYALNRALPDSIYIETVAEMPEIFHARYHAIGKTYEYVINQDVKPSPIRHNYCHYVAERLDIEAIEQAIHHFKGTHDFAGFMASGSSVENTIRTIYEFELLKEGGDLRFRISGDGFLYNMIRIIVGLLIQIGRGKIPPNEVTKIILSKDRNRAKWTAPANGLYLKKVHYPLNYDVILNGIRQS